MPDLNKEEERREYSVKVLNSKIEQFIVNSIKLNKVWITGELSNVKKYNYVYYFSLKDDEAQVSCIMFYRDGVKINCELKDGMSVRVRAEAAFYAKEGRFQLKVYELEERGHGDLYLTYLRLKEKYEQLGYFDPRIKKKLPLLPQKVGVVSSAQGAVIRDILNVSGRRFPRRNILLYPSLVQGSTAPAKIIKALTYLDSRDDIDVIIIARGGGSVEDLWCFNDENLIQAIYNCRKPVVSAVGHETDFTLCDFVSDKRAATPSQAAEIVWPEYESLARTLLDFSSFIDRNLKHKLDNYSQSLVLATEKIKLGTYKSIDGRKQSLQAYIRQLNELSPYKILQHRRQYLQKSVFDFETYYERNLNVCKIKFKNLTAQLQALSPQQVLQRGYAFVSKDKTIINKMNVLKKGDKLDISFADGRVSCKVEELISFEQGNNDRN